MTLISLIVVLFADRIAMHTAYWQAEFYTFRFHSLLEKKSLYQQNASTLSILASVLGPALILLVLVNNIDNSFIRLIFDTAILMVCIGCPTLREAYKCYLQAANRGDFQACSMYADQMGHEDNTGRSFGQLLVWLNYQHYAAIIIWFALLGSAGAVLYVLTRSSVSWLNNNAHKVPDELSRLMVILDWLPVRVTSLGLLLVGHFSRALPIWLRYMFDVHTPAKDVLCDVAKAAEEIEADENDCTEEPCTLVRLAKRNVMFLVVVISGLSLSGWLY